jgi:hypothetical protein
MANKGKNFKSVANDIAEGFITVNPIFLKPFDKDNILALYKAIERKQIEIRAEPFPYNDNYLTRKRNLRLQRLFHALMIIKNFAREKNLPLFR